MSATLKAMNWLLPDLDVSDAFIMYRFESIPLCDICLIFSHVILFFGEINFPKLHSVLVTSTGIHIEFRVRFDTL